MAIRNQFFCQPIRPILYAGVMVLLTACSHDSVTDQNLLCSRTGSHTNASKVVNGSGQCVMLCSTDQDCDLDYYAGCIDQADDGTKICGGSARDRDSGTDGGG